MENVAVGPSFSFLRSPSGCNQEANVGWKVCCGFALCHEFLGSDGELRPFASEKSR